MINKNPPDTADAYSSADAYLKNAGVVTEPAAVREAAIMAAQQSERNAFVAGWYAHQRYLGRKP